MSPAGGGAGGGPDSQIASTIFSIFSYAGCLQTVATVCCRRNYWFHRLLVFPALFSCSFSTPCTPASGGQLPATFPVDFVPLCVARKAWTNDPCSRHTGTWFVHATQPNRLT